MCDSNNNGKRDVLVVRFSIEFSNGVDMKLNGFIMRFGIEFCFNVVFISDIWHWDLVLTFGIVVKYCNLALGFNMGFSARLSTGVKYGVQYWSLASII